MKSIPSSPRPSVKWPYWQWNCAEAPGDVDKAWEDIRLALQKAQRDFPTGVPLPTLDENQMDQDAVVLAVSGSSDPLVLLQAARRIKRRLQTLADVSQVHFIADPLEQVTIELDDAAANRIGLTPTDLVQRLSARNSILPGGSITVGGRISYACAQSVSSNPLRRLPTPPFCFKTARPSHCPKSPASESGRPSLRQPACDSMEKCA